MMAQRIFEGGVRERRTRVGAGLIVLLTGLLALPAYAGAQDANLNLFLFEKSYVARGTPTVLGAPGYYTREPDLLAEAQMVAHFPLSRGVDLQTLRDGEGRGFNLFLTTQFRLRGLDVPSGPVRSPSFMPRFVAQYLIAHHGSETRRNVLGIQAAMAHHSNGGDGCVFVDESYGPDGKKCISSLPAGTPAGKREVRTSGGNFSTNYWEVGIYHRVGSVADDPRDHWKWNVDAGLAVQFHHSGDYPLPGGAEGDFARLYGTTRLQVHLAGMALLGGWLATRTWLHLERFDPPAQRFPGARNYRFEGELVFQPTPNPGRKEWWVRPLSRIGLGVRYTRGQDYYNTQFVRDIRNVQLILIVDPWSPWLG